MQHDVAPTLDIIINYIVTNYSIDTVCHKIFGDKAMSILLSLYKICIC